MTEKCTRCGWMPEPPPTLVDEFSEADELRAELTELEDRRKYASQRVRVWRERQGECGRQRITLKVELEAAQKRIVELEDAIESWSELQEKSRRYIIKLEDTALGAKEGMLCSNCRHIGAEGCVKFRPFSIQRESCWDDRHAWEPIAPEKSCGTCGHGGDGVPGCEWFSLAGAECTGWKPKS